MSKPTSTEGALPQPRKPFVRPKDATVNVATGIMILLMGQTGAGKSHFIASAGADKAKIGHTLSSEELEVRSYVVKNPNVEDPMNYRSRVVLVDTPGLNNAKITDSEILKRIGAWLNNNCDDNVWVAGIIFLHDITEDRATAYADNHAWPIKYFDSAALLEHIVLATGKWDLDFVKKTRRFYEAREEKLKEMVAWKKLIVRGAELCRYEGDYESAWRTINTLLEKDAVTLQLMRKDFTMIQQKMPMLKRPKAGFWTKFRNLFSRVG